MDDYASMLRTTWGENISKPQFSTGYTVGQCHYPLETGIEEMPPVEQATVCIYVLAVQIYFTYAFRLIFMAFRVIRKLNKVIDTEVIIKYKKLNLVKHSNSLNVKRLVECEYGHADTELTGLRLYRRKNKCMKLTTRNTTFQTITSRLHLYRAAHTMKRPHPVTVKTQNTVDSDEVERPKVKTLNLDTISKGDEFKSL